MYRKPHLTLLSSVCGETSPGTSQIQPGQEVECLRALNVKAAAARQLFYGSVGCSASPDQQSQPETLKRQKKNPVSQPNRRHLVLALIMGNIKKRENILSIY